MDTMLFWSKKHFKIRAMGDEDEISNEKLLELLLDLQKNLAQNTTSVTQIANNIEEIKQQ